MKKIAILVQGPSDNVTEVKKAFNNSPDLIFSTWKGYEDKYNLTDTVVYSDDPTVQGHRSLILQQTTTYNGLLKAKELNYTHVLKIRSDLIPTNYNNFLSIIDNDKLNFLSWHYHEVYPNCPGYFVDYLMSGPIDEMLLLWNIKEFNWCIVSEVFLTWQYITQLKTKIDINFFLNDLTAENNLYWIKKNIHLISYKQTLVDPYKKYTFGHLTENYLTLSYRNFLNK